MLNDKVTKIVKFVMLAMKRLLKNPQRILPLCLIAYMMIYLSISYVLFDKSLSLIC